MVAQFHSVMGAKVHISVAIRDACLKGSSRCRFKVSLKPFLLPICRNSSDKVLHAAAI